MPEFTFDTNAPAQVNGLIGWSVDPIFTVGEKIGTYVPPGILDGIGAFSLNDTTVRLYVNHETGNTVGYKYTLANGTQLPGSRVSFFDVDKRTFQITNSGLAFDKIINRKGEVVDAASDLDYAGLNRFCSGALFEANQFGAGIGLVDRMYMAGEEAQDGTQFALDTATNTLYAVPWFGRAQWENVTEINTGRTDKVAFIIGDDTSNAPLYLYVGNKKGTSFLDRNGLADGELFVWVADDPANPTDAIERDASTFKGNNASTNGKFVKIDYFDPTKASTTGYDAQGFATQAKQNELADAVSAFKFSRPEDVATNPNDGTQVVLASTGVNGLPDVHGTTYRIDVDFVDFTTNNFTAKIDILVDGNVDGATGLGLRSPDNLDWADDGIIYIQEDRANGRALFEGSATPPQGPQEASIFRIDPANANPSSTLTRIAQVNRTALPATQTDASVGDTGNWETSGILDVSTLFGAKAGELFIFDVQAHSLRDGSIITATNLDGDGNGATREENLVEGGQLAFLIAPNAKLVQSSSSVVGTNRADKFEAGVKNGFDGTNDIVSTGAGNDRVDSSNGFGNNLIDTGKGNDKITLANGDRVSAGSGNDKVNAVNASNYFIDGGAGNDTFFLGVSGTVLGGDGNDSFFANTCDDVFFDPNGSGNLLYGGAGKDKFWLFNGESASSPITILDFEVGKDVIGFIGVGKGTFCQLTRCGETISFNGETIATLAGIDTSKLTANSFKFDKDF